MEIDILIEDPIWDAAMLEQTAGRSFQAAMAELELEGAFDVSLLACDDARIATLNAEFRGKPAATNVLSWPSEERAPDAPGDMPRLPRATLCGPPQELGDIALAHGVLTREAEAAGIPFEHHLAHLLVHALLHLLGFDHMTEPDAALMEGLETRILARLGIPDPY